MSGFIPEGQGIVTPFWWKWMDISSCIGEKKGMPFVPSFRLFMFPDIPYARRFLVVGLDDNSPRDPVEEP